MRHSERFVVYGLLGLLVAAALSQGRAGSTATADPVFADDLGPADALVLRGAKGELKIRNADARIAWGDQPTDRAHSLAFVHVDKLMTKLLEAPRFADERKAIEDKERDKMKEFESKREEFMKQYGQVRPDHPDFEKASDAWKALREGMEQWHAEIGQANEKLMKEQIESSWKDVLSAIEIVSGRRNIDLVLRFVPMSEKFEAEEPTGGISQLMERTVLKMPESMDITPEVMKELNLTDE